MCFLSLSLNVFDISAPFKLKPAVTTFGFVLGVQAPSHRFSKMTCRMRVGLLQNTLCVPGEASSVLGDSLFRDYGVYCGDSGGAFKVSIAAKTSLLEPVHTFCSSPLADSAHCCHVIFLLMTLDACVCPLILMAALSSSSVARSTTGWSPSLESLHLAASLIFRSSCAPVPVSLCVREMESHF